MVNDNIFGERLYLLREERGLTMAVVGEVVGTSKSTVNKWEKGRCEPGIKIAVKLANFFNVSPDWLIGASDDRQYVKRSLERIIDSLSEQEKQDVLRYAEFVKAKNTNK